MAYAVFKEKSDGYMDSKRCIVANYINYELAKQRFYEEIDEFDGERLRNNGRNIYYFLSPHEVMGLEEIEFEDEQ